MSSNLSVALVSMPWISPSIPSIQLATLAHTLGRDGIASDRHEFFLDYAALIGVDLYNALSDEDVLNEYLFALADPDYAGVGLDEFLELRRSSGFGSTEFQRAALGAIATVTPGFIAELVERVDWPSYDAIGFSLTIAQTAASMTLARAIRKRFPDIPLIFGGSACAGLMGAALLRACPAVDVAVSIEGELVFPRLIRALHDKDSLEEILGTSWRNDGIVVTNASPASPGLAFERAEPLNYHPYFERRDRLGLADRIETWLPFESSRGCWYGEKRQCTFCGLHEIMTFRQRNWSDVLSELEELQQAYDCNRFFAVDLIMPNSYYSSLLPEVSLRGHEWQIFYEIKANVRRSQLECLSGAGVRWIQPGIESLDTEILGLMRKGVSAAQNVQLLKWARELGIRVTWNLITGIPEEPPAAYEAMAHLMRNLYHLPPPTGASRFSLHRFSPYFEDPAAFGIEPLGADRLWRHVFPVDQAELDALIYYHKYRVDRAIEPDVYTRPAIEAIAEWKTAASRTAQLAIGGLHDGFASIVDTRWSATPTIHSLGAAEYSLYRLLDEAVMLRDVEARFAERHRSHAVEIAGGPGFDRLLADWEALGLIARIDGKLLALATDASAERHDANSLENMRAPIPYLQTVQS